MPLTSTQLVFIARILADPPELDFPQLLDDLDSAVRDLAYALIVAVDEYNLENLEVGEEAAEKGLRDPDLANVAYVAGNRADFGRGLFINGLPRPLQPDIVSTVERRVVSATRRAFTEARLETEI